MRWKQVEKAAGKQPPAGGESAPDAAGRRRRGRLRANADDGPRARPTSGSASTCSRISSRAPQRTTGAPSTSTSRRRSAPCASMTASRRWSRRYSVEARGGAERGDRREDPPAHARDVRVRTGRRAAERSTPPAHRASADKSSAVEHAGRAKPGTGQAFPRRSARHGGGCSSRSRSTPACVAAS